MRVSGPELEAVLALLRGDPLPLAGVEFERLREALFAHALGGAAVHAVERSDGTPGPAVPAAFRRACRDAYLTSATKNKLLLREAARCSEALDAAGVPHRFFKGVALLAGGVYPREGERELSDMDLVIAPERIGAALEALAGCGYWPISRDPLHDSRWRGEVTLYPPRGWHPVLEPRIDLHTAFDYGLFRYFRGEWDRRLADALLTREGGAPGGIPIPDPSAHLVVLILHLILHLPQEFCGKWLADVHALLLRQPIDASFVRDALSRAGVRRIAAGLLAGMAAEIGTPVPPELLAAAPPRFAAARLRPSHLFREKGFHRNHMVAYAMRIALDERPFRAAARGLRAIWPAPRWVRDRYGPRAHPFRTRALRLGRASLWAVGLRRGKLRDATALDDVIAAGVPAPAAGPPGSQAGDR